MFGKLCFQLAASFLIVTSQNKVSVLDNVVVGGSEIVGGIFNFFGNIPRVLQHTIVLSDRVEDKVDAIDDIYITERKVDENSNSKSKKNNSCNKVSNVMNRTRIKESEQKASPNIIQFGKVVIDGAVGEGSKIVGGVFNFFGKILKLIPRPTVSFERIEKIDDIEVRNGRVEDDDDVLMLENSQIDLVLETTYCGIKVPTITLLEVMTNISRFSTFLELVEYANLESELSRDGGVTVLAPNNQAFDKLNLPRLEMLFSDQNLAKQTVLSHIVNEVLCCAEISRNNGILLNNSLRRSLTGSLISFRKTASGNLYADKSQINKTFCDKIFKNGVIHEIGRLL